MRLAALAASIILSCAFASSAGADEDRLPTQLAGTGSIISDAGKTTPTPWSISIQSQDEDGNLKGTVNWSGRTCQLSAVRFTGTYRNGVLDISAPETGPRCGALTITLTKSAIGELLLEGTARFHGSPNPVAVTLHRR